MKEGKSKEKAPRQKKVKGEAAMHVTEEEDFPRGSQGAYIAPVEGKRIRKVILHYMQMLYCVDCGCSRG